MIDVVAYGLIGACVVFGLVAFGTAIAQRVPGTVNFYLAVAAEIGVLLQVAIVVVGFATGARTEHLATFIGYLVASVFILPLGVFWTIAERTKWSAVVLGVGFLVEAVILLRMIQVWSTAGG